GSAPTRGRGRTGPRGTPAPGSWRVGARRGAARTARGHAARRGPSPQSPRPGSARSPRSRRSRPPPSLVRGRSPKPRDLTVRSSYPVVRPSVEPGEQPQGTTRVVLGGVGVEVRQLLVEPGGLV